MMVLCCSILTCILLQTQIFYNDQPLEIDTFGWSLLAGFFYASQAVVNERIFKIDERLQPL